MLSRAAWGPGLLSATREQGQPGPEEAEVALADTRAACCPGQNGCLGVRLLPLLPGLRMRHQGQSDRATAPPPPEPGAWGALPA